VPSVNEILSILEDPTINLNVNLLGVPLADRPAFFAQLAPSLQAMRARTGRPHWLVVDEAHHLLPDTWGHATAVLPLKLQKTILVTVHANHIAPAVLAPIDVVIALGAAPQKTLEEFAQASGKSFSWPADLTCRTDNAAAWFRSDGLPPFEISLPSGRAERIRHLRKYAEGDLRWHSFYFRGPAGQQNLKAQNLMVFCQIAQGIDESTWLFHLRRGDYSRWFRNAIKDEYLADETERLERRSDLTGWQSRQMIRNLVNARYTLPE
jgi:hypothetical protein